MSQGTEALIDLSVSAELGGFPAQRRHALISEAAYFRAESRGFAPGADLDDWLEAEWEVDQRLSEHGFASAAAGA